MKVVVDFDECASNGVCVGIVPDVFELRNDFLVVLDDRPPAELREPIREAVSCCPVGAISIEED